ncbi:MAG: SDR family NAD(P)-dependent oxidoreductase, partial [Planctomycetaceae bacterium]
MHLNLDGSVALVVGGANGIGLAVAETFAGEGASVALWDIAQAVHAQADRLAGEQGVPVVGEVVDVTDPEGIAAALESTQVRLGPIDHLVHAAAIGSGRFGFPFTNLDPSDWRSVLEVNVMGLVQVAHAVTPGMVRREAGSVLFVASVAGQIGSSTDPPYSASKAAGINFVQCMAQDLAPHGVRVNS